MISEPQFQNVCDWDDFYRANKMNATPQTKGNMKTSFEIPNSAKVVVILDARDADALGRLLKYAIRKTQRNEDVEALPGVAFLRSVQQALQNESYVLEDGNPWLHDAECSLARGDKDFEKEAA